MKMVLEQRINKSSRNYKAEKHENVHIALILAFKSWVFGSSNEMTSENRS